jgi:hypothetical protein
VLIGVKLLLVEIVNRPYRPPSNTIYNWLLLFRESRIRRKTAKIMAYGIAAAKAMLKKECKTNFFKWYYHSIYIYYE